MAAGVAHAEGVVDQMRLGVGELPRQFVELDVLRMNEGIDLTEAEERVARLQSEDREHRMRPEDTAARQVPVPQATASAVERGIDAGTHGFVDDVGLSCARRLPVKGEAEDEDDEAGGRGQRHRQGGI